MPMYAVQRPQEYIKFFKNLKEAEEYAEKLTNEYEILIDVIEIKDNIVMHIILDY